MLKFAKIFVKNRARKFPFLHKLPEVPTYQVIFVDFLSKTQFSTVFFSIFTKTVSFFFQLRRGQKWLHPPLSLSLSEDQRKNQIWNFPFLPENVSNSDFRLFWRENIKKRENYEKTEKSLLISGKWFMTSFGKDQRKSLTFWTK